MMIGRAFGMKSQPSDLTAGSFASGGWMGRWVLLGHGHSGGFLDAGEFFVGHAGVLACAGVGDGDELIRVHGCHVLQARLEKGHEIRVVLGELDKAGLGLVGEATEGPVDALDEDLVVGLLINAVAGLVAYGDGDEGSGSRDG